MDFFDFACPYPNCSNPFHFWLTDDFDHYPKRLEARWRHLMLPCCEWCRVWRHFADDFVFDIHADPFGLADFYGNDIFVHIHHLFQDIHYFYMRRKNSDSLDTALVSRDVDEMAQLVLDCWRMYPLEFPSFKLLARELAKMAKALLTNRPRQLYYTMARLKIR